MSLDPSKTTSIKSAFCAEETARRRWGLSAQSTHEQTALRGYMITNHDVHPPYKAVLEYSDGSKSYHPFETMRTGEAFIRSEIPMPQTSEDPRKSPQGAWSHPSI